MEEEDDVNKQDFEEMKSNDIVTARATPVKFNTLGRRHPSMIANSTDRKLVCCVNHLKMMNSPKLAFPNPLFKSTQKTLVPS